MDETYRKLLTESLLFIWNQKAINIPQTKWMSDSISNLEKGLNRHGYSEREIFKFMTPEQQEKLKQYKQKVAFHDQC